MMSTNRQIINNEQKIHTICRVQKYFEVVGIKIYSHIIGFVYNDVTSCVFITLEKNLILFTENTGATFSFLILIKLIIILNITYIRCLFPCLIIKLSKVS